MLIYPILICKQVCCDEYTMEKPIEAIHADEFNKTAVSVRRQPLSNNRHFWRVFYVNVLEGSCRVLIIVFHPIK